MWRIPMAGQRVSVKFGGQIDQVDIHTFTRVLLDYTEVAKAAGRIADPNITVDANITAVRPGCLVVDLSLVAQGLGGLFKNPETAMQTLAGAVTIATGFYEFKKFLGRHGRIKASAPEGEDHKRVTARDGSTILVNNGVINLYMGSEEANKAVNSTFDSLDNDQRIESVEISGDGIKTFRAERPTFPDLASSPSYEGAETRHEMEQTELVVVKPVLAKTSKRKWEFIWRGVKMSANIADRDFLQNRLLEEGFYVGSIMEAELDITQRYDEDAHAFLNVGYEVTRVGAIRKPPKNRSLFGDESEVGGRCS